MMFLTMTVLKLQHPSIHFLITLLGHRAAGANSTTIGWRRGSPWPGHQSDAETHTNNLWLQQLFLFCTTHCTPSACFWIFSYWRTYYNLPLGRNRPSPPLSCSAGVSNAVQYHKMEHNDHSVVHSVLFYSELGATMRPLSWLGRDGKTGCQVPFFQTCLWDEAKKEFALMNA